MALWPTTLRIVDNDFRVLVTSPQGDDLIKARLPVHSPHPRALLTLLEGVALFSGEPLHVVISADEQHDAWRSTPVRELWPTESALVYFDFAIRPRRPRRVLRGVADFRQTRRHLRLV